VSYFQLLSYRSLGETEDNHQAMYGTLACADALITASSRTIFPETCFVLVFFSKDLCSAV